MTPFIAAHAAGAALALTLGAVNLLRRRKGDLPHRIVGWTWVALMYWVIVSSFFIRRLHPGHLSWIHGLSAFTFVTLTVGVVTAVRGNVAQHRGFMTGSYLGLVGAFVGAVAVPSRAVPQFAVDDPGGFATAVVVLVAATGAVWVATAAAGRRPRRSQAGTSQVRTSRAG